MKYEIASPSGIILQSKINAKALFHRARNDYRFAATFIFVFLAFTCLYAAFEEREISARTLGLSGVSVGLADDIAAVVYNPAGLANLHSLNFSASDANFYDILNYRFFSFATPTVEKAGTFGLAFEEFGFKDQYKETKFRFSHGINIMKNLSIGYTMKLFGLKILYDNNKYTEKSLTSFDFALLYRISKEISAGMSLSNINSPKVAAEEKILINYKLGIGYKPTTDVTVGVDFEKGNLWRFGIELKPKNIIVFRSGINFNPIKFSFGLGLNLWQLSLDYGVSYHPQLELQRIVTVTFRHTFGRRIKPAPAEIREIKKEIALPIEKPVEEPNLPTELPTVVPEIPKVNINTCDEKDLITLGLRESVAKNIVRYRRYKGNFKTIDELRKVPGVTKKIFESIKDKIKIGCRQ